jgi:hypothetical protein
MHNIILTLPNPCNNTLDAVNFNFVIENRNQLIISLQDTFKICSDLDENVILRPIYNGRQITV